MKELRLAEGRNTGVAKIFRSMEDNGSPPPQFDFDPDLSYFRVTLLAHPEYIAIAALRDAAYLKATGDEQRALARIHAAWEAHPTSALLATSLIHEHAERQDLEAARGVHDRFAETKAGYAGVAAAMADAYLDAGRRTDALTMLDRLPVVLSPVEAFNPELHQHTFVQQQTAVSIAVRIKQKNQVCTELGGLFDNLAEDAEASDADPDELKRLKTELDKAQRALERLEDNQDPDDRKEARGPLQRLKGSVDDIADAETSLGKLAKSIEGGSETARKAIDLYNKLAPLFGMPPTPNPTPKP